jgi:hypothetical protein
MEDKLCRRFGLSDTRQANLAASTQIKRMRVANRT